MELKLYLKILTKQWRIVMLVTIVTFCATFLGSQLISPTYQTETRLRIITPLGGWVNETSYQTTYAIRLMNTYAQIATSEKTMNELKINLNLKYLPDIEVDVIPDSEIISIFVKSDDPVLATSVANSLAEILVSYQDQAVNGTKSDELSILVNREDEIEAELTRSQLEYDQLIQAYAETMAEISVLERGLQINESFYQNMMNQYEQIVISEAGYTTSTESPAKIAIAKELDRTQSELDAMNKQYKELLTSSNKISQQISLIRESIRNSQSEDSSLQERYDTALANTYRQENAQKIIVISPAFEPSNPIGLSRRLVLGLGVVFAVMFGGVSAFVVEGLRDNVEIGKNTVEHSMVDLELLK